MVEGFRPRHARPADIDIRLPVLGRIWIVGFGVVWLFFVGTMVRQARGVTTLVMMAMMVFGATLCWRVSRLRAFTEGDVLRVRGLLRDERVQRHEIVAVHAPPVKFPPPHRGPLGFRGGLPSVFIELRDKRSVVVEVLPLIRFPLFMPRLEPNLTELRRWAGWTRADPGPPPADL